MNTPIKDIGYALRQLRRGPGFTLTVVLTLALGIGASTAIFCLMDGLWLHPMRVPHPGELVRVFATSEQGAEGTFTYPAFQVLAQRTSALKNVMAIGNRGSIMPRSDGTAALLLVNVVSSNFFEALGVKPLIGRAFTERDATQLRSHPGVILGYSFWRREFGGDPGVVGRQITLLRGRDHRNAVDIWGVLPPSFREIENNADRDLWMPAETWAAVASPEELTSRKFRWFNVLGRLAPGATVAQANQQVAAAAQAMEQADPEANRGYGARAISDFRYRMNEAGTSGLVLFAIVGCVVLLATVNVAHLLLARGLTRTPEVALRLSLGAWRGTIARQLLTENLLLGALGLLAGLGVAGGVAIALPRLLVHGPAMLVAVGSSESNFAMDARMFLFAGAVAVIAMLLLSVVPLVQAAKAQLLPVLQSRSAMRTDGRTPLLRQAAIWIQIAISFALLVSTTVLVRSFLNTRTQPIGLTRDQVLLAWTQDPDEPMRSEVFGGLRALPGVTSVAYAIRAPLSLSEGGITVRTLFPNHPELHDPVDIKFNAVSPGFLDVIGTHIVRGRGFTSADDADGPPVVIINQAMAQKYWPGQNPIGQTVHMPGVQVGPVKGADARVVGVAENAPINRIGEIPEPYLYLPYHLVDMGEITFALRTSQNAMSLAQSARQVLIHENPLLDPMMVTSLPELIRYSAADYQMMAELVTALGFIGLALTVVGLYGFLAFRVTQRRREIGIRMALGATREATALLILRDTGRLAIVGLALGVVLAAAAARLESSVVFGVRPIDPFSLVAALCVLLTCAAAASWLPARRAASIEPMQALRTE